MPSYTLELEIFGTFTNDIPGFQIWDDGELNSSYTASASGTSISLSVSYTGSIPSSLEFRFTDVSNEADRSIEIRQVKINDRHVNTNNFLTLGTLTKGQSATVDVVAAEFLFNDNQPDLSEFSSTTIDATTGNDSMRHFLTSEDQVIDALAGRDIIYLGSGDDKVNGGEGNDRIRGGAGHDLLFGAEGNDRLQGDAGDDILFGGTGNDRIQGDDGDDEIHGGDGNDRLSGNAGNDIITGGNGDDKITGGGGTDSLYGDAGNDIILGGVDADTIDGGDDDDVIYGGANDDIIDGGDGDDIIIGDAGDDIINGGDGEDTIFGRGDDDDINGGAGDDTIDGGSGIDTIRGGADNDTISGGEGADILDGDSGDDEITGGAGADTINGGDDNDTIFGGADIDTLNGDAGDDIIDGGADADIITGGAGADLIFGGADIDSINGNDGNDTIIGGTGFDVILGGEGNDVIHAQGTDYETIQTLLTDNPLVSYNVATNSFYQYVATGSDITASAAETAANAASLNGVSGHLVNITTSAENTFVSTLTSGNAIWLGASDAGTEGQWIWTDGAEADAQFWDGNANGRATGYENWDGDAPSGDNDLALPTAGDKLGVSVSISGDYVIASAIESDLGASAGGAVYVWNAVTGEEAALYIPPEVRSSAGVGDGVDIDGNFIVVGASNMDVTGAQLAGSAYVYDITTGQEVFKFVASDAAEFNSYGETVAIDGNFVAVGDGENDSEATDAGAVYVYNLTTGAEVYKLTASDAAADDHFGQSTSGTTGEISNSLAIDGDYLVVGAPDNDDDGADSGSVYVYDLTDGSETYKLTASDAAAGDYFGMTVAVSGDFALIGSDDDTYLFDLTDGSEVRKFGVSGESVSIDGENIVSANDDTGVVSVYDRDTGVLQYTITSAETNFGESVSIDGDYIAVGSDRENSDTGAVHIYNVSDGSFVRTDFNAGITGQDFAYMQADGTWADTASDPWAQVSSHDAIEGYVIEWDAGLMDADFLDSFLLDLIQGEDGDDIIYGYTGTNSLDGLADDDIIYGGVDAESFIGGGDGNDIIYAGAGNDTSILGGFGDDIIFGGAGNDSSQGGDGDDIMFGGTGNDTLSGLGDDDIIYGEAGTDTLNGGDDNDALNGGADADTLNGGDGLDMLIGADAADELNGGDGNDQLHGSGLTRSEITTILDANTGVVYNEATNSFYQYFDRGLDTQALDAFSTAENVTINGVAGHLVNITSAIENAFITTLTGGENAWIGATDDDVEGQWQWQSGVEDDLNFWNGDSTGSANAYENWALGEPDDLIPVTVAGGDGFGGEGLSISGTTAIAGIISGGAIIWDAVTGSGTTLFLEGDDTVSGDVFGESVAIKGDYILVGAPGHNSDAGAAYLFDITTGDQVYKLTASDGAASDDFGGEGSALSQSKAVDLDGDVAVVAAPDDESDAGAVYVYDLTDGSQTFKITAADGEAGDDFGSSVEIDGDYIVVGAADNAGAGNANSGIGSVYVYDATDASETYQFFGVSAENDFGESVAVDGDFLVVGAGGVDSDRGAAYVYDLTDGSLLHTLTASNRGSSDDFGEAVAIGGDYIAVGAGDEDTEGSNAGAVYIFDRVTGAELYMLTAPDGAGSDDFGEAVAIDGDYVIIGAGDNDEEGTNAGSVYTFDLTDGSFVRQNFGAPAGLENQDYAYIDSSGEWVSTASDPWAQDAGQDGITGFVVEWDAGSMSDDDANDELNGDDGDDILYGYGGDDTLSGGDGLDVLIGGADADTFVFEDANAFNDVDIIVDFSTADSDVLDLSDLLSEYDSGSENITDFVQITDDGENSSVFVDTTGAGAFDASKQVATLTGVTGLTDEATLESNGNIVA